MLLVSFPDPNTHMRRRMVMLSWLCTSLVIIFQIVLHNLYAWGACTGTGIAIVARVQA